MLKVIIGGVVVVVAGWLAITVIGFALHIILGMLVPLAIGAAGGAYAHAKIAGGSRRSLTGKERASLYS